MNTCTLFWTDKHFIGRPESSEFWGENRFVGSKVLYIMWVQNFGSD